MKPIYKFLILLEVIFCFGPLFLILSLGLIVIPAAIFGAFEGVFGYLPLLGMVLVGILGFTALICVLLHIFNPTQKYISAKKLRLFILMGFLSLSAMFYSAVQESLWGIYLLAPIVASIHFIYLGRRYVFHNS